MAAKRRKKVQGGVFECVGVRVPVCEWDGFLTADMTLIKAFRKCRIWIVVPSLRWRLWLWMRRRGRGRWEVRFCRRGAEMQRGQRLNGSMTAHVGLWFWQREWCAREWAEFGDQRGKWPNFVADRLFFRLEILAIGFKNRFDPPTHVSSCRRLFARTLPPLRRRCARNQRLPSAFKTAQCRGRVPETQNQYCHQSRQQRRGHSRWWALFGQGTQEIWLWRRASVQAQARTRRYRGQAAR